MQLSGQNRTLGFGLLIIITGFVILLHQMRVMPYYIDNIIFSWQMLLIALGLFNVFYAQSRIFGYILIAVGGFFILPLIFDLPYNFLRNFWPFILIVVGLFIIFRHGFNRKESLSMDGMDDDMKFIDEFNMFSGSEKRISIKGFKGGRITSIFGGSEIDLREAELSPDRNIIELFYLFGGSTIKVPNDWVVVNKVNAIFGGFADKRNVKVENSNDPQKILVLTGTVLFGGGEIQG